MKLYKQKLIIDDVLLSNHLEETTEDIFIIKQTPKYKFFN